MNNWSFDIRVNNIQFILMKAFLPSYFDTVDSIIAKTVGLDRQNYYFNQIDTYLLIVATVEMSYDECFIPTKIVMRLIISRVLYKNSIVFIINYKSHS